MENRKRLVEADILREIRSDGWGLPPLAVSVEVLSSANETGFDALVSLSWGGKVHLFGAEVQRLGTPKAVTETANRLLRNPTGQLRPLLIAPYLGDDRLRELEQLGVSGIDLCGNGVVIVPGELLVYRSGSPNRFRWEGGIKNVYRGASAVVARAFLVSPESSSVGELLDRIRKLGGEVTLPTISKVCKSLEEELIIERGQRAGSSSRSLRLLQPDRLLDLLRENFALPESIRAFTGKFEGGADGLVERLLDWEKESGQRVVRTGADSVDAYAVMAREPIRSFYCSDLDSLQQSLGNTLVETNRFPTVKLVQTKDVAVYFDRRQGLVASPVQTYLELAAGDKRDQETAEQVRRLLRQQLPTPNAVSPRP